MRAFGTEVLVRTGVPHQDAHLLADSLVQAELWGHSSHGMLRLPWYVARLPRSDRPAERADSEETAAIPAGRIL